ncbi:restriction endonuclease subunit S [Candidatus Pelagibacter sp.]|nr:restriction endonuclease subunit S [Candidatus Pelagibacter sp.]
MKIKTSTIDELCHVEYGTRVTRKKDSRESGKIYPVYGGGGKTFFIDKINRKNRTIIARFAMSEKCTRFVKGDFFLNDSGLTLSPKTSELSQEYLDKIILASNNLIYQLGRGTAQKNLDMKRFRMLKLSYPTSLDEQQRIVAKLDLVFAEVDKVEKNYNKKKLEIDLIKNKFLFNKFSKVKNFKLTLLNEICNKITDGSHNPPKISEGSSFMMLSSKNIFDDSINYEKPRLISEESFHSENKRTDIKKNDVLLTIVGTIGRCAVVKSNDIKFTLQRSVAVFKPKNDLVESRFLMYLLQSLILDFKKQAAGVAQQGIYLKQLKNTEVKIPPLDEQKKLVNEIDKFNNKLEELNKILIKQKINYNSLRLSILSQKIKKIAA